MGAYWGVAATLSGSLIDPSGNTVFTVSLTYDGSNGDFSGVFGDKNFYPPLGTGYTLVVQGTSDSGNDFKASIRAEVVSGPRFIALETMPQSPIVGG